MIVMFCASTTAFVLVRMPFKGSAFLFGCFLLGVVVPIRLALAPLFVIVKSLGLRDTLWGVILVQSASMMPVAVFILTAFLKAVPSELEDAAKMDGALPFQIYWRVVLPLVRPALATVALLTFVQAWNEYFLPLIFLTLEQQLPDHARHLAVPAAVRCAVAPDVRGHPDHADPDHRRLPARLASVHPGPDPGRPQGIAMAAISIRNLNKAYGKIRVLHDINLDIADNSFVVFVGPSGCGKSTLLRTIAGLEDKETGTIHARRQATSPTRRRSTATSRWCSRATRSIRR